MCQRLGHPWGCVERASGWGTPLPTLPSSPPPLLPSAGTGASESSWPCFLSSATSFVCISSSKTSTSLPSVVAAPVLFVLPISSTSYSLLSFQRGFENKQLNACAPSSMFHWQTRVYCAGAEGQGEVRGWAPEPGTSIAEFWLHVSVPLCDLGQGDQPL